MELKTPRFSTAIGSNLYAINIIKDIYIAQVRNGHKCAMSAEMAVWLRNCHSSTNPESLVKISLVDFEITDQTGIIKFFFKQMQNM